MPELVILVWSEAGCSASGAVVVWWYGGAVVVWWYGGMVEHSGSIGGVAGITTGTLREDQPRKKAP